MEYKLGEKVSTCGTLSQKASGHIVAMFHPQYVEKYILQETTVWDTHFPDWRDKAVFLVALHMPAKIVKDVENCPVTRMMYYVRDEICEFDELIREIEEKI